MTGEGAAAERLAATTPPLGLSDTEAQIDMPRLRAFRLGRVQEQLRGHDVVLALLVDPVSIRYASGFRSFAMFQSHLPTAYLVVPAEGRCVLHGAASEAARQGVVERIRAVNDEDIGILERLQAGRGSEGYDGGPFSPLHEPTVHNFQRLIAEALAGTRP